MWTTITRDPFFCASAVADRTAACASVDPSVARRMVSNTPLSIAVTTHGRIGVFPYARWANPPMSGRRLTAMLVWVIVFSIWEEIVFKRIVLGLDGSDESTKALAFARKLAASEDAHVEIVHVHEYMIAGRARHAAGAGRRG